MARTSELAPQCAFVYHGLTNQERCAISIRRRHYSIAIGLLVGAWIVLAGCTRATGNVVPTRVLPTSIPAPTPLRPLPTVPAPGSDQNPYVFLFAIPNPEGAEAAAEALGDAMSSVSGLTVEVQVTDSYGDALTALCEHQSIGTSLDAFTYLAAASGGCGTVLSVLEHDGQTASRGQFLARDAFLPQSYRGVFCRPDGASLNGWIIPALTLRARGVNPTTDLFSIVDAGSEEEVVRMIDAGECGLGATTFGAEATVRGLQFPERIRVLEQLAPVPNDVLVISSLVDQDTRETLTDLLTGQSSELAAMMGGSALQPATDALFSDLRALFADAGVDPVALSE